MTDAARPDVVVVGAGIAGLCAAYELTGGPGGPDDRTPRVTIVEQSDRIGGKLAALEVGDVVLDAGPDGALARRPELMVLCKDLGIDDQLVPIAASGASVFARGQLRPLPEQLLLGVPTSWRALRESGTISPSGLLRALLDVIAPRPASRGPLQDRSIGALVETKLGREVVHTLVEPLLGGIAAGRVDEMSAAAVFPPLLEAAQQRGSLMAALRAQVPGGGARPEPRDEGSTETHAAEPPPAFMSLAGGMHALCEALEATLLERGVTLRTSTEADGLRRASGSPRWWVDAGSTTAPADGVVLAVPAGPTARLLRPHDAEAAALLDQIDYASVAIVTLVFAEDDVTLPQTGTGVLVPPGTPLPAGPSAGDRFMTTALTFLDRKWPHLKRDGETVLRVHLGRIDDDRPLDLDDESLLGVATDELRFLLGEIGAPRRSAIQRWPSSLPQYRVNHLMRVGGIESGVARLSGLAVAGAAYRGVGVPACIASGRAAGRTVLSQVVDEAR